MELGQDKAWCLANLVQIYAFTKATADYKTSLEELRRIDPDQAAEIEKETAESEETSDAEVSKEKL